MGEFQSPDAFDEEWYDLEWFGTGVRRPDGTWYASGWFGNQWFARGWFGTETSGFEVYNTRGSGTASRRRVERKPWKPYELVRDFKRRPTDKPKPDEPQVVLQPEDLFPGPSAEDLLLESMRAASIAKRRAEEELILMTI